MYYDVYSTSASRAIMPSKDEVEKWVAKNKYADMSFGIKPDSGKIYVITGLNEDEEELPPLRYPVIIHDKGDNITVVDIRQFVKRNISIGDTLDKIINTKGLGDYYVKMGLLMLGASYNSIDSIIEDSINISANILTSKLSSSLMLDEYDRMAINESLYMFLIKYGFNHLQLGEQIARFEKYLPKSELYYGEIKEKMQDNWYHEEMFLDILKTYEVSERLKKLDTEGLHTILKTLAFGNLQTDITVGFGFNIIYIPMFETLVSNPLYRKSSMATMLNKNKRSLKIDDYNKKLHRFYIQNNLDI